MPLNDTSEAQQVEGHSSAALELEQVHLEHPTATLESPVADTPAPEPADKYFDPVEEQESTFSG